MANYQLGPESPRPFAVLTENHVRRHIELSYLPEHERYSFGPEYESKMCQLIHKYLELDPSDRLCYVGEPRGSLAGMLQQKFCLLNPVNSVVPGHIHYEESPNHKMLPVKLDHVGAEDYFSRVTSGKHGPAPQYDKLLFNDVIRYLDDPRQTYQEALKTLAEFGRIVFIQRPADMNTLPMFSQAKERLMSIEHNYLQIIRDLQACKMDVQWEIEFLPIVTTKAKWYSMMRDRFPSQMEAVSDFEVVGGLRELSEGVMKYGDDRVEFVDRLLFISASKNQLSDIPKIGRYGMAAPASHPLPPNEKQKMTYEMEITNDVEKLVSEKNRRERIQAPPRKLVNTSLF